MDSSVTIDGQTYELLGLQRGGAAVFRGYSSYVRLGTSEVIQRDLALHRAMERAKYPVARILSEGELIGNMAYFVEESLGARSFRAIFQEDSESGTAISKEHLDAFTAMLKRLFGAQIKFSEKSWDVNEFAEGIKLPLLMKELPSYREQIAARFEKACEKITRLPGTLLHGDCNPANVYEKGIIDLEDSFRGPLGYDIVSALTTIDWMPQTRMYEFSARYAFTDEQRTTYYQAFNKLMAKASLPNLDSFVEDLAFCRAVWLCTGMHEWPRTQQWRFEKFISAYLS